MTDDDKHARAQTFAHVEDLEREVARLQLLTKVGDWVKADAARFRWLQEHTVAAGLGRFMQQHRTQFLAEAVDAATKAERAREDLMSVERGRKVGDLTRSIRKQQGRL